MVELIGKLNEIGIDCTINDAINDEIDCKNTLFDIKSFQYFNHNNDSNRAGQILLQLFIAQFHKDIDMNDSHF